MDSPQRKPSVDSSQGNGRPMVARAKRVLESAPGTDEKTLAGALPVGSRVPCLWRDNKYYQSVIVERRKAGKLTRTASMGDIAGAPQRNSPGLSDSFSGFEYYMHYEEFNRRLDEWVPESKLNLNSVLKPGEEAPEHEQAASPDMGTRKMTRNWRRKWDKIHHKQIQGVMDPDMEAAEKEHEEATKVKNINTIELGRFEVDTWYYSPYPDEFVECPKLYICEFCLKYMRKRKTLVRHKGVCQLRSPPGDEVYRDGDVSVFEIDGRTNKTYCQNLCLLAKLFLDHKTLYYDFKKDDKTQTCDGDGCHLAAYFSKEKHSPEHNILACILTMPPFQRKGYGSFLIAFAYELSRKEGKIGSPEKPLSDLGLLGFRSYWTTVILNVLRENKARITIKEISEITRIKTDDIVFTLQSLNLVRYWKGKFVISVTPKVIEDHFRRKKGKYKLPEIKTEKLHWDGKAKE